MITVWSWYDTCMPFTIRLGVLSLSLDFALISLHSSRLWVCIWYSIPFSKTQFSRLLWSNGTCLILSPYAYTQSQFRSHSEKNSCSQSFKMSNLVHGFLRYSARYFLVCRDRPNDQPHHWLHHLKTDPMTIHNGSYDPPRDQPHDRHHEWPHYWHYDWPKLWC